MYDPIKMVYIYYTEKGRKQKVYLTHTENMLLYCLNENKNKIVSLEELSAFMLEAKLDYNNYKIIVTAKSRLVKKLKKHLIIVTYNKVGYMLTKLGE